MTSFTELIVGVHDHLDRAGVPHAIGGALALAYIAEPRGTIDIDVNVFLDVDELGRVDDALAPLDVHRSPDAGPDVPVAGVRFLHATSPFPVDVFPSLDERYRQIEERVVHHPFGDRGHVLPFLSGEDLCVFKLSFGRAKDWVDLQSVAAAGTPIDLDYVEDQLVGLRGPTMHPQVARFRALLRRRDDQP